MAFIAGDGLMLLGFLTAALSTIAFLPYIIDTWAGRTQPHRASWFIWSALAWVSFFSQMYEGASHSLWFQAAQASGTLTIFLMSIRQGTGNILGPRNLPVMLAALAGLALWFTLETSVYALVIIIAVGAMGAIATVRKAYENPKSETLSCWMLALTASGLAIATVGAGDWVLLAYPLYLFTLYAAIVSAVMLGRRRREIRLAGLLNAA